MLPEVGYSGGFIMGLPADQTDTSTAPMLCNTRLDEFGDLIAIKQAITRGFLDRGVTLIGWDNPIHKGAISSGELHLARQSKQ
jgi:hypothetical protein